MKSLKSIRHLIVNAVWIAALAISATGISAEASTAEVVVNSTDERIEIKVGDQVIALTVDPKTKRKTLEGHRYPNRATVTADYLAYLPHRQSLVGWNKGDSRQWTNSYDKAYFVTTESGAMILPGSDEEAAFYRWELRDGNLRTLSPTQGNFIIRRGVSSNGILADRTLVFEMMAKSTRIHLFDKLKLEHMWDNLKEIHPEFASRVYSAKEWKGKLKDMPKKGYLRYSHGFFTDIRKLNEYIQFAHPTEKNQLEAVTLGSDLKLRNTRSPVIFTHVMPEVLNVSLDRESSRVFGINANGHARSEDIPLSMGRRTRPPTQYKGFFLTPHSTMEELFVPLGLDGNYLSMGQDVLGIIPLHIETFHKNHDGVNTARFMLTLNWLTAIEGKLEGKDRLLWGWATPELGLYTPALWQDWDFYAGPTPFRNSSEMKMGDMGPKQTVRLVEGEILMGQLLDGTWQMYAQPNMISDKETRDQPNTYSGQIASGKTYEEAVEKGTTYLRKMAVDHVNKVAQTIKIADSNVAKDTYQNEWLEKRQAEEKAYQQKVEANNKKAEAERNRSYTTSASYKGIERSFTTRLQTMRAVGGSQRATKALQDATRQLREGKK